MVTIQFVPRTEIEGLSGLGKIRKLLNIAKSNKIVLLQGKLKKEEEAELIKTTMEEINKNFKGIELAVVNPTPTNQEGIMKIKNEIMNWLFADTQGLTIIGPSTIVKSNKKDPNKIEPLTKEAKRK